jgi:midasin
MASAVSACRSQEERLYWLAVQGGRSSVLPKQTLSAKLLSEIESVFHGLYENWKDQLDRDQKLAAANSSIYKYRGEDDSQEDPTAEELESMFPQYDNEQKPQELDVTSQQKAQSIVAEVARLYHAIYSDSHDHSDTLIDLQLRFTRLSFSRLSMTNEMSMAPGLMCALQDVKDNLVNQQTVQQENIYLDANISQCKRLLQLLEQVRTRFEKLHDAWPDHATPIDVLRACSAIENLSHGQPLAGFIPPVEKLHATISEWQKVASKEFSVLELLDSLTDLVVSWRQLELTTWAGLFDREDLNCQRDAAAWWYIAYETTIRASEDIGDDITAIQDFARQFAETVNYFLAQCGLGEFTSRLNMLRDFKADLNVRSQKSSCYTIVKNTLAGIVHFHAYFEEVVRAHLVSKRADLDKQVKNVIQLASWKDRNLDTLRISAKSSHKKLFRLVRKYRRVLSEPVAPYLQGSFPNAIAADSQHPRTLSRAIRPSIDKNEFTFDIRQWHQQSGDLVLLAAGYHQTPLAATIVPEPIINGPNLIRDWLNELQEDVRELQRATPKVLNDENKPRIQQLKVQKRRLLADVLKDVRSMGFQTNLSEDVLAGQKAIHVILPRTSPAPENDVQYQTANFDFYRMLHTMPSVRSAAAKHSDDLTPAEIARARVLLEGTLQSSIQQQATLAKCASYVAEFDQAFAQMVVFATSQQPHRRNAKCLGEVIMDAVSIAEVVRASVHCVRTQGSMANTDYSIITRTLEQDAVIIETMVTDLKRFTSLPSNIDDAQVRQHETTYHIVLQRIDAVVREAIETHCELEPTFSCLGRWVIQAKGVESRAVAASTLTANQWVHSLLHLTEQVHDCICGHTRLGNIESGEPLAKAWLFKQRTHLEGKLDTLCIQEIVQKMSTLMQGLSSIQTKDEFALPELASLSRISLPILQAYATTVDLTLKSMCELQSATSTMAHQLGLHFVQLANDGFCGPAEKSQGNEQSKEVESGTGLGDGEGAEDISKDIADDEDLSELAQEPKTQDQDDPLDAEKDAVDMADEDFEGEMDEGAESQEDETEKDDQSEADLEEEAGRGDELGAEADDEKTWEGGGKDAQDKEGEDTKGKRSEEIGAAGDEADEDEKMPENGDDALEEPANEADNENVDQPDGLDQVDAQAKEEQNLDLPEDIVMDGDNASIGSIESDLDDDFGSEVGDEMRDDQSATPQANPESPEQVEGDGSQAEQDADEDKDDIDESANAGDDIEEESQDEPEQTDENVAAMESKDTAPLELTETMNAADAGQGHDENQVNQSAVTASTTQDGEEKEPLDQSMADAGDADGQESGLEKRMPGQAENSDRKQAVPFKQLGDALKQWYDQHREIEAAQDNDVADEDSTDQVDTNDQRFQHLPDEADTDPDMQALGTASAEQTKSLNDDNAVPMDEGDDPEADRTEPEKTIPEDGEDVEMQDSSLQPDLNASDSRLDRNAMIGPPMQMDMSEVEQQQQRDEEDQIRDVDDQLTNTHLSKDAQGNMLTIVEARTLWAEHEARTRTMAIVLSEHLRLILNPTQATKMRGDFRAGKRLNIKKIIPYIASSYKRDKIWMRRAIPSKRSYQIMLAIDDSESMTERESKNLAFDTLALVAKGMAMLEVGEVCVVGFGEEINVAHDFGLPYTSEAGAEILRQFTFAQSKTDVRKLLQESISLFREARMRATGSASDLWQVQLIISDGECEDHASIRQLVRQAHEERIMVVFIIVDSAARNTTDSTKQSILDLSRAEFVKDANGEAQLKMTKYLDTFPFQYYLIVRDVLELPGVLAGALRQWFAEVVEAGG